MRERSLLACGTMRRPWRITHPLLRGANGSRECAPDDRLRDEAIHTFCADDMDRFVEPVIGRARSRDPLARNDDHHVAVPFMVGWPSEFAVHNSMPASVSLALVENSLPSNSGCTPR